MVSSLSYDIFTSCPSVKLSDLQWLNLLLKFKIADTESDAFPEPQAKKIKVYKQKYNALWERDPQLRQWLAPIRKNPHKAFCKNCDKELVAGLSELKKHMNSKKHQENTKSLKQTRSITEMVATDSVTEQVKKSRN